MTHKEIKNWLDKCRVTKYTIRPNGIVDVDGGVWVTSTSCSDTLLPIQFGTVTGEFFVVDAPLLSMKGAPQQVGGDFTWQYSDGGSNIASLEYAPKIIGGRFFCHGMAIKSLSGIDKIIKRINGRFYCSELEGRPRAATHILGVLLIKGITHIDIDEGPIDAIMNKYVGTGDILSAQDELIDAGLFDQARL